jgi:DNA-binding response OmpR family regulator
MGEPGTGNTPTSEGADQGSGAPNWGTGPLAGVPSSQETLTSPPAFDSDVDAPVLKSGDLSLDLGTRRVTLHGEIHTLTETECLMLILLIQNRGRPKARKDLMAEIWGADHRARSNVVDVHIAGLRRKLGQEQIVTVRGLGYGLA